MAELTFIGSTHRAPDDDEALDAYSRSVIAVAERLTPSVANLRVSRRVRGGRRLAGGGSAVVITPDGFMLTSSHVIERMDGGRASFVDGRELDFDVVGSDPLSDLALLRASARDLRAAMPGVAARLGRESGIEVVEVVEESPAARAGLRPEDLIVELNGAPVQTVDDIQKLMVGDLIGAQVHARVLREGSERELDLVPVELVG